MRVTIIFTFLLATSSSIATAESPYTIRALARQYLVYRNEFDHLFERFLTNQNLAEIAKKDSCIRHEMDFSEHSIKKVESFRSAFLITGASVLCLYDQEKFFKHVADVLYEMAKSYDHIEYMECLQLEFKKMQPNSRILRNFTYKIADDETKFCENVPELTAIKDRIKIEEEKYCTLRELSCGAVDRKKALEYVLNFVVLTTLNDEEEINYELEAIGHKIREDVKHVVHCLKKMFENWSYRVYSR